MPYYVAESRDSTITLRGKRISGVRAEKYETVGPIFMFIVRLTEDERATLRPLVDEEGRDWPGRVAFSGESRWWFALHGSARWPGVRGVGGSSLRGATGKILPAPLTEPKIAALRAIGVVFPSD
jgi:hypothetical protein